MATAKARDRRRRRAHLAALVRDLNSRTAREAGELGFVPRALVQTNLPYRSVPGETFSRRAGHQRLHLQAPPGVGLPYGRYPRLLVVWLATQAVRKRSPRLDCGRSLTAFLKELGLTASGGAHGPIGRFRDQMRRLFSTSFTVTWEQGDHFAMDGYRIARRTYLWWRPVPADGASRPNSVTLSLDFFDDLWEAPVPVDLRIVRALVPPLALDVYCWLSYRLHTLRRTLYLPWPRLHEQFGTQFRRVRDFRRAFIEAMKRVLFLYPDPRVEARTEHLVVRPLKYPERGPLGRLR